MPSAEAAGTSIGRSRWRYPRRRRSNQQAHSRTVRANPQNRPRGVARPASGRRFMRFRMDYRRRSARPRTTPPATAICRGKGISKRRSPHPVVDGHAARDCDRSVSLPRRRYSDHDGDRYGRRRARVAFALARLGLPLNATRAASPAARTTVPAAYMHMHRRAASGSAWKLSAMNAHSSETEFAADSPLEGGVTSELVSGIRRRASIWHFIPA